MRYVHGFVLDFAIILFVHLDFGIVMAGVFFAGFIHSRRGIPEYFFISKNMKIELLKLLFSKKETILRWIKEKYYTMFREEFTVTEKVVNVKKGKRKYSLMFIHTPDRQIKVNLGRYA